MLLSVWHTSWTVSDLDRSIRFYRDELGFELVGRLSRKGRYIETVVGFEKAELEIAFLRIPGVPALSNHHLELIQYLVPAGVRLDIRTCNVGAAHLALATDDIQADYRRLSGRDVPFVSPPVEVETGPAAGSFACYLRDPDGFTIELVQPAPVQAGSAAA